MLSLSQYETNFPLFDTEYWIKPFSEPEQVKLHAYYFTIFNCSVSSEFLFPTVEDWGKLYTHEHVFTSSENAIQQIPSSLDTGKTTLHALKLGTRVLLKTSQEEFEISAVRFALGHDTASVHYYLSSLVSGNRFSYSNKDIFKLSEFDVIRTNNEEVLSYLDNNGH